MKKLTTWRSSVLVATAVGMTAGIIGLAPTSASARSVTKCANKSIKVQTSSVPVKAITTEGGVSCATAYKVIAGSLEGAKSVEGFTFRPGGFKAPEGLFPETASKGSKKIKFAIRPG